ncbi:MAG: hypothetical protein EDM71_09035 [Proteobacteria bacterium]|nr:MAG: hypothetical protein EDM71_09035 [Pseudomonadota bacterium]MBC6945842.1 hypothetical protein [Gammaproteobacteria bacterium]MCE7895431.1 hypothetical protein [Gammaproteobacteria bacterium PRO8]MDL1879828.1 hypothetical protein [Gammaproteobacteria bacterium PRO2]MCL4776918.1 hypothetical protein [Gammaproteobacteria bacterium]
MRLAAALLAGLLFGLGLLLSGMANPAKVLAFLDVTGAWDPSLAFVMAGAVAAALPAFAWARRRTQALTGVPLALPTARAIDQRLVLGSLVFGVGWGLAGFCPGPAVVAIGLAPGAAAPFIAAMLAGMAVFEWLEWRARSG